MLFTVLMVAYLLVAAAIIGLVLIQQGKGADMGASFGAGASGTLFGSTGSGNFLTRATAICAVLFFVLSLVLGNMSSHKGKVTSDFETIEVEQPVQDNLPQ
ncbi:MULTISPECIES: preprotein translocase subunit SecG [unclassified Ferrimonas]|uniref:preprotein translocase subunit SecG n=1 Tax=unclassified Ferrimonas TaxID=2620587 RepID=UPI002573D42B|nr:preprotein translocase subunit SecG [Ferrimonas sp. YFM]BDY03845.1 preprotein translocase subunit SecG [Ferrimonas sp. YFM]